jgi:hypothetical protein
VFVAEESVTPLFNHTVGAANKDLTVADRKELSPGSHEAVGGRESILEDRAKRWQAKD